MRYTIIFFIMLLPAATQESKAQQANRPDERAHHTGVYDPLLKGFVIYGGYIFENGAQKATGDIWAWDGSNWRETAHTNDQRIVAPLAFDYKRQRLLMFGGADDKTTEGDLKVLENKQWRTLTDSAAMERGDAGLVYDRKRDRLVLFGGVNKEHQFLGDTWEFDGMRWTKVSSSGPSPRSGFAMTYDAARGKTVLYGGFAPGAELSDTWEWDGKNWKEVSRQGPGPRAWPCFAYDARRHRNILFGGEDNKDSHLYTDTWAWNGKAWARLTTDGPTGRIQFAMDYDPARDRVVLFGGFTTPPHYLHDTWEFDGTKWVEAKE